jgi:hypothetical protein
MKTKGVLTALVLVVVLISTPLWAADPTGPSEGKEGGQSLTEVNKKLTNPVSELWSISFQQNNYVVSTVTGHGDEWNSNLNFQPVLPVSLTKDWNLITRPVLTLFNSTPYPSVTQDPVTHQPQTEIKRTTAFGDMIWMEMLSPGPSIAGNWLLGIGPTFIFPTAASDFTGQGKWQVGPAALVGYLSHKWILGAFVQNWTSFAGDSSRPDTNQMNLQPIAAYFLEDGWSIGYTGNILANWKASSGNIWTVPLGVGINKVVKLGRLPVKLSLAGQYMPIHPDDFGQKWNVQVQIVPVIPKLIKGALFD